MLAYIRERHRALFSALPCPVALSYIALTCPGTDSKKFFCPALPSGPDLAGQGALQGALMDSWIDSIMVKKYIKCDKL